MKDRKGRLITERNGIRSAKGGQRLHCREVRGLIPAHVIRRLPEHMKCLVDAHLDVCSRCRVVNSALKLALVKEAQRRGLRQSRRRRSPP